MLLCLAMRASCLFSAELGFKMKFDFVIPKIKSVVPE